MHVKVTAHAVDQARARYPGMPAVFGSAAAAIRTDVREALAAGRRSVKKPRAAVLYAHARKRAGGEGVLRYLWTPGHERVYVARRERGAWVVLTALGRVDGAAPIDGA